MPAKPKGIAPHFLVADVVRAAEYYRDKLGFEIGPYFQRPPVFVIVQRDGIAIQLARMEEGRGARTETGKAMPSTPISGSRTPIGCIGSSRL